MISPAIKNATKDQLRIWSENDLFFLAHDILGYTALEEKPHLEVCDFLTGPESKKLLLLPRDTFKTTIGTISFAIQEIVKNPNVRILIFSETFSQSKKFLSEIKQQLEQNQQLIGLYGKFVRDPGWREDAITVRQRTAVHKEPTVTAGGVDVVGVGFHYDIIIVDDPHSQKNINTRDQIEKVIYSFRLLSPMLDPGGRIHVTATRWHDLDLASTLLKDDRWKNMVKSAEFRKDGIMQYFFPERY